MKKVQCFILLFLVLTTSISFSQDFRERFHFGLKAGANLSNVYDTQGEEFVDDFKLGFAGGMYVSIPLGKFLAIQPEVMFSQKGFKSKGTFLGEEFSFKRTTSYVEFPVLLAIRPAKWLSLVVGPQFSFQVINKDKSSFGSLSTEDQEMFKKGDYKRFLIGGHFGLDINIGHFVISPRAGFDFMNNKVKGETKEDLNYKNYFLQLTLGYRF